jgi:hypothetical protein
MIDWDEARKVWNVTVQTGVLVVGMTIGYQMIRSDLNQQMKQTETFELRLREIDLELQRLAVEQKLQGQKLDDFHFIYDRDFDKYIRDPRDFSTKKGRSE